MVAYLDTNAFDNLYRRIGCTGADIANLRKAIYGRALSIRLSIHSLEEILLTRRASPQAFAAQIKLTLSIANSRTLIKPCDQLVCDDIRAYRAHGAADRPFLRGEMQNAVTAGVAALIESDGEELEDEFVEALEDARRGKDRFREMLARVTTIVGARVQTQRPSFDQYWETYSARAAEALADIAGPATIEPDRIDGLLTVKSVRITAGLALSATYEAAFDPDYNVAEMAGFHHAVSAAAVAETFVTGDPRLRAIVSRIPADGFTVMSLPDFLKRAI